jgi:hypothetical protein
MSFRMVKKRRAGDKSVVHTASEIVRCEFDGSLVVANCTGTNARRALEKRGFVLVQEPPKKAKAKPKRARDEDGQFKGDDLSTPDVDEAWKPPKKKSAKKPTKKK